MRHCLARDFVDLSGVAEGFQLARIIHDGRNIDELH